MSALLYYRPRALLTPESAVLPGMDVFSNYLRLYHIVSPVDTTDTIRMPVRMKNVFPLPALRPDPSSYEDVCNERARELLARSEKLNIPLYVSYSGGIDSTLTLVSLLKFATASQKKNITVFLSEDSITENPNFYRDHIRGQLSVRSSLLLSQFVGENVIIVNGELNDQVFGSDIIASLINLHGPASMHEPYDPEKIITLFDKSIQQKNISRSLVHTLERVKNASPVPIETNFDILWWFNFALKWQSVYFRSLASVSPKHVHAITQPYLDLHYAPFFATDHFRLWSMNNRDKRIKETWDTYKWPSKEVIYDYNKDVEYRDHKLKNGSLSKIMWRNEAYNFIDDSLHFHTELPLNDYFVPENDFVTR